MLPSPPPAPTTERGGPPRTPRPARPVAVFDFDGTLATGRSTFRFVRRLASGPRLVAAAIEGVWALRRPSRTAFKSAAVGTVLRGRPWHEVEEHGEAMARHILDHHLDPGAVELLEGHRRAGHRLVLLTGALDAYTLPIGDALGFDAVLATGIVVHEGTCTGGQTHVDLRGRRKVERLRDWLGPGVEPAVYAYGDSRADLELLRYAAWTRRQGG